jgi:hypothetical protein
MLAQCTGSGMGLSHFWSGPAFSHLQRCSQGSLQRQLLFSPFWRVR